MNDRSLFDENNASKTSVDNGAKGSLEVFSNYSQALAESTRKRQQKELALFRAFLVEKGKSVGDLSQQVQAWKQVQREDVKDFIYHLAQEGYAASSVNMYLHTIKTYCRLATIANVFDQHEYHLINNLHATGSVKGTIHFPKDTEEPLLKDTHVEHLLKQPDTSQGRRDKLLLLLLVRYGLRPKDITTLNRNSIDFSKETLTFYNHYLDDYQTYRLDKETIRAAQLYLSDELASDPIDPLFSGHRKDRTTAIRLTDRAINSRIRTLGVAIGLSHLSPQDCQEYWKNCGGKEKTKALITTDDKLVPKQSPKNRKQRPDVFNRQEFEWNLRKQGVPESLIAPTVSDFRILMPLLIREIGQDEFFRLVEHCRDELHLGPQADFWKQEIMDYTNWARNVIEKYKETRQ